jgi:glycosyltransferase involved in cell wall biosynthesis
VRQIAAAADLVYVAAALAVDGAPGRVVPMGVDVAALNGVARAAARARLGVDGFTALYLGRLVPDKGADLLLDALPDGVTLLLAGDGPERARLERAAAGRPSVRFVGEARGPDKRALLAAADALVVPSRRDGAPTVVREALALGLPLVATRAGGIPELVRHGHTALLCPPTAPALAAALTRLRDDPALAAALSANARATAATHDWSAVGPRLAGALAAHRGRGTLRVTRV